MDMPMDMLPDLPDQLHMEQQQQQQQQEDPAMMLPDEAPGMQHGGPEDNVIPPPAPPTPPPPLDFGLGGDQVQSLQHCMPVLHVAYTHTQRHASISSF